MSGVAAMVRACWPGSLPPAGPTPRATPRVPVSSKDQRRRYEQPDLERGVVWPDAVGFGVGRLVPKAWGSGPDGCPVQPISMPSVSD